MLLTTMPHDLFPTECDGYESDWDLTRAHDEIAQLLRDGHVVVSGALNITQRHG